MFVQKKNAHLSFVIDIFVIKAKAMAEREYEIFEWSVVLLTFISQLCSC